MSKPDPICQFLPDTTLTFVNRAYADFYGREPEELIGKRWLDFNSQLMSVNIGHGHPKVIKAIQ